MLIIKENLAAVYVDSAVYVEFFIYLTLSTCHDELLCYR